MKSVVSESKKKEVAELIKLFNQYKIIGVADLTNLPSAQLQEMRSNLRESIYIKTSKKRLIKRALQKQDNEKLKKIFTYIKETMPVLIFSNEDVFGIYQKITKNKSTAPAKAGQKAPNDLTIQAGPTNFPPGPIIGELGQAGLIAAVEDGKVTIKQDTIVAKEGEEISSEVADILTKLGIEPMEVKLNIIAFYQDGIIYTKKVLDIDPQEYLNDLQNAHQQAFKLTIGINYILPENIEYYLQKANQQAKALADELGILTPEKLEEQIIEASKGAENLNKNIPETSKKETKPEDTQKQEFQQNEEEKQPGNSKEPTSSPQKQEDHQPRKESDEEDLSKEEKQELTQEQKQQVGPQADKHGYTEENVAVAQDILTKMQDEKIKKDTESEKEKKKPKVPSAYELAERKEEKK